MDNLKLMDNLNGLKWITRRKHQWLAYQLMAKLLYALAITLVIVAILLCFVPLPLWVYVLTLGACFTGLLFFSGIVNIGHSEIAHMLDVRFPQLQHSASLLLKPSHALGTLQQLQVNRLQQSVSDLSATDFISYRALYRPLIAVSLAAVVYLGISHYVAPRLDRYRNNSLDEIVAQPTKPPVALPPTVTAAQVVIKAPIYTKLPEHKQNHLNIVAPIGSTIDLHLTTSTSAGEMAVLLDGKTQLALQRHPTDSLQWEASFKPQKSGFYQLVLDGELSALYPLELIPDLPVSIQVTNPEQYTIIDFGFPEIVDLKATLKDDYAIANAQLVATISTGKGEGVSFKSHEIPLSTAIVGRKDATLTQKIDLKKLGMASGDELYFYLKANDYTGQESRSDVFVVVLQDTAALFSMSGMVSGVDLVPEYFRSQRQIIMDTEKLIAEMDTLSTPEAQNKSNNLGIDQQLLRLRYGQFLGEEAEDDIGGHIGHNHDDDHPGHSHLPKEEIVSHGRVRDWKNHDPNHEGHEDHAEEFERANAAEVPIDVGELIAAMSHQHDRAEDATFFDAEQKAHLKATLTEMWNTELRLRTYKPQEALPYAYKALRLLKELQQKSRVYVGKAPTKTTPLSPEKRLTGDLEEIAGATRQYSAVEDPSSLTMRQDLQRTLAFLSNLKTTQQLDDTGLRLLLMAEGSILEAASLEPTKYLGALKAIRLLEERSGKNSLAEIQLVEKAIHDLLPTLMQQPLKKSHASKQNIYQLYFDQLTH